VEYRQRGAAQIDRPAGENDILVRKLLIFCTKRNVTAVKIFKELCPRADTQIETKLLRVEQVNGSE
jgi:hypothetical protein